MSKSTLTVSLGTIFVVALVALTMLAGSRAEAVVQASSLQAATTSAAVSVTTSTRIMATTSNPLDPANSFTRVYATVCNPNANPVVINMDFDKPASLSQATYIIAAAAGYNACFEIGGDNGYDGSITASSTNQTATTITVKQYVK